MHCLQPLPRFSGIHRWFEVALPLSPRVGGTVADRHGRSGKGSDLRRHIGERRRDGGKVFEVVAARALGASAYITFAVSSSPCTGRVFVLVKGRSPERFLVLLVHVPALPTQVRDSGQSKVRLMALSQNCACVRDARDDALSCSCRQMSRGGEAAAHRVRSSRVSVAVALSVAAAKDSPSASEICAILCVRE